MGASIKNRVNTCPDGPEGVGTRSDLGPLADVIFGRSCGDIGRGEVALVEGADLVRLERPDDGVQESSVMEQDEVLLLPVVWVHELFW